MIDRRSAIGYALLVVTVGLSTPTRAQQAEADPTPPASTTATNASQAPPQSPSLPMDQHVGRLVSQLGDDDYYAREAAQAALQRLPAGALVHMARHYRDTSDAEVRMRLEQVARHAFRQSLLGQYLPMHRQPFLGIQMQRQSTADGGANIAVVAVLDDTAASKAGLQPGDSILEVDQQVPPPDQPTAWLVEYIQQQGIGDELRLRIERNDRTVELTATLQPRPIDLVDDDKKRAMLARREHLEQLWWNHAFTQGRISIPGALLDDQNAPQSRSDRDENTRESTRR